MSMWSLRPEEIKFSLSSQSIRCPGWFGVTWYIEGDIPRFWGKWLDPVAWSLSQTLLTILNWLSLGLGEPLVLYPHRYYKFLWAIKILIDLIYLPNERDLCRVTWRLECFKRILLLCDLQPETMTTECLLCISVLPMHSMKCCVCSRIAEVSSLEFLHIQEPPSKLFPLGYVQTNRCPSR